MLRHFVSLEFFVLSGGNQRCALLRHKSEEMKKINIQFSRVVIKPTTCRVYSHTLCSCATTGFNLTNNLTENMTFPVIEVTESPHNINMLCNEMLNGMVYKSAKMESTVNEPLNNLELKICYQIEDESGETQILLSNDKCTYKVKQSNEASNSTLSLSQISQDDSSLAWMKMQDNVNQYPTTYFEQFTILLCRMLLQISRNRQGKFY